MKILRLHSNVLPATLITLYILSLPFFSLRIPFATTSISIVSLFAILVCITLPLYAFWRHTPITPPRENLLWYYGVLCIIAFIPTLLYNPSSHAYGVVIEWLFLPLCTAFCISHYSPHPKKTSHTITTALLFLLILLITDACITVFTGAITFDHRVQGSFYTSPNQLAMLLAPIFFFMLSSRAIFRSRRYLVIPLLACTGGILVLTQSLSSLLALTITVTLWYITTHSYQWRTYFIGGTLLILLFVSVVSIKAINSPVFYTHSSITSRLMIWDTTQFLLHNNTLIGHEIDSFQSAYLAVQPFFPPYNDWAVPTPHNLALTLLFSGGILALTTYMILFSRIFFLGFVHRHQKHILSPALTLFLIIITGCTDTSLWSIDRGHLFWIITTLMVLGIHQKAHPNHGVL